jgi:hypothetical protein
MSTEDDTFNKLRREPFNKVMIEVGIARLRTSVLREKSTVDDILKRAGWTKEDYEVEMQRLNYEWNSFAVKPLQNGDFEVYKEVKGLYK